MKLINKIGRLPLLLAMLAFMGCNKEKEIIPSEGEGTISRFEFPQGNKSWDQKFKEIHDNFEIYVIYKDVTNADLNKVWVGSMGATYGGQNVPDDQMPAYEQLLTKYVFAQINPEIAKKVLPPYLYLQDDFHNMFMSYKNPREDYYEGMDFWVTSLNKYQVQNLTPDTAKIRSNRLINQIITTAVNKGVIKQPKGFDEGIDYVKAIVRTVGTETDPNHYKNRGFVDVVSPTAFMSASAPLNIAAVNKLNADFLNYIRIAMLHDEAKFRTIYPKAQYPLINKRYDMINEWMKTEYGFDLKEIAKLH